MISIILYGRNDNYGYNLHKRAAISINCLAEILEQDADEILFVDYNTPDDFPTFPEAIQDTLTPQAKAKLRILRVRPRLHQRYRARTHLAAVEPIARNVALRRANPANRWILSTNTDIVLVPRRARTLSEIAAALPAGMYHVPRFELPEALWESFDRTDPRQIIEDVRALGASLHLNEIVHADEVILYDAPGDFQLIDRDALVALDGFDEEMILGWHVDSNLAKRFTLKFGPVRSLLDEVLCYHCDHTRYPTTAHRRGQVQNDWRRFYDDVPCADLPKQREKWGCPGEAIEEFRLPADAAGAFRGMLQSVLPPPSRPFTETFDGHGSRYYHPPHVLPFLADLLGCYPREARLGWCGARKDMLDLACRAWRRLGFDRPVMVDKAAAALLGEGRADAWTLAERAEWLQAADLLVFEFGRPGERAAQAGAPRTEHGAPADEEAVLTVRGAFLDALAHERSRLCAQPDAAPRRFIGINCINNEMEELFTDHIGITLTPLSSRLRHGFVTTPEKPTTPELPEGAAVGRTLGRLDPIGPDELRLAYDLFMPLLEEEGIAEPELHRAVLNAALGRAFIEAIGRLGGRDDGEKVIRALARLERARPSTRLRALFGGSVEDGPRTAPGDRALSRFAAFEDWDDPLWSRFLDPFAAEPGRANGWRRGSWLWERAHLLYGLERSGSLGPAVRLLVVATEPEAAIAALSERVGLVEVIDPSGACPHADAAARAHWAGGLPYVPERLRILPPATAFGDLEAGAYEAVVFLHDPMFGPWMTGLAGLAAAEPLVKPGGLVVVRAEVAAGAAPHRDFLDAGLVEADGFAARLGRFTGLSAEGGFDARLSRETIDKLAPADGPMPDQDYFLWRHGERILIPSLWFLQKRGRTRPEGWERLRRWLAARLLGEQRERLEIGAAGERLPSGSIALSAGRAGAVFSGPALPMPSGQYRFSVSLAIEKAAAAGSALGLEAVADGAVLAGRVFDEAAVRGGRLGLEFALPPRLQAGWSELQLTAASSGALNATFTSVELLRLGGEEREMEIAELNSARPGDPVVLLDEADLPGPAERPLSRLAAWEDWYDPDWSRFLEVYEAASMPGQRIGRDRSAWEQTHLLYGLDRAGKLTPETRVLVAASAPERAIAALTECAGAVDVFPLGGETTQKGAAARLHWTDGMLYARDRLRIVDGAGPDAPKNDAYDAIVFPRGSLFADGITGAIRLVAAAEPLLKADGVLVFSAEVAADGRPPAAFEAGLLGTEGLVAQLEGAGLVAEDGFDARISRATFENELPAREGADAEGFLLRRQDGRILVPGMWFLGKRPASREGWEQVGRWLADRFLGDQLPRLQVGAAGRRGEEGRIEAVSRRTGHVFYGPYLPLPPGRYRAIVEFDNRRRSRRGAIAVEAVAGRQRFVYEKIGVRRPGRHVHSLAFEIPPPALTGKTGKVEIRAWSNGVAAEFTACRLARVDEG